MEKMGTLKKNGDQKTNFGPHGDQSPQMGTNVGAVNISAGNLFKIIFRVSAERVQALPINLRYIYKRVFH